MLLQYILYFSDIKGIVFTVGPIYTGTVKGGAMNTDPNWRVNLQIRQYNNNVFSSIMRAATVEHAVDNTNITKFAAILELCPDLFIINKNISKENTYTYDIEKINYKLDWIRSEFYK